MTKTDKIVKIVGTNFPTFGGGQMSNFNPITNALSNKPYCFAAGVGVKEVVEFVLKLSKSKKI
jgi:hypothetical protein